MSQKSGFNVREWILPFILTAITMIGINYYFVGRQDSDMSLSGKRFEAPMAGIEVHKPLNLEVDFIDSEKPKKAIITDIETPHAVYQFSTEGASLQQFQFKRNVGNTVQHISTVFPPNMYQRDQRCFLVAFEKATPYNFELLNHKETEYSHVLTYQAHFSEGLLRKEFIIYKDTFAIDIEISLQPKNAGQSLIPRMFFIAPMIPELGTEDLFEGVINEGQDNKLKVYRKGPEVFGSYWAHPSLFGGQDRYFIHAMTKDTNNFVQRGYYKTVDERGFQAILEGPETTQETTWKIQFYFGPKVASDMNKVDERLEQTINYGFFGFVSKYLSQFFLLLLNFIHTYVYNYGVAIIVLTVLIKLVMLPFTYQSKKALAQSAEYSKKLKYIQEKYKNDAEGLNKARLELFQKNGTGLGACLPLLLQLPIFLALRDILSVSVELYKSPFLWINDLSIPDPLYIFPIITGLVIIAQSLSEDSQQRLMKVGMGVFFSAILVSLSAGLSLYMAVNSLFDAFVNYVMTKFKKA